MKAIAILIGLALSFIGAARLLFWYVDTHDEPFRHRSD